MSRIPPKPGGTGGGTSVPGTAATRQETMLAAAQALGLFPSDAAYFWEDFIGLTALWSLGVSGTGVATSATAGFKGGIYELATGTTAASTARLTRGNRTVGNCATDKWYIASRMQVQTAITAQSKAYVGIWNTASTASIGIGVFGNGGTTNFMVQTDGIEAGTFKDLGVAIDTNYHIFEIWSTGADNKVYARVDGGTTQSTVAQVSPPTDGGIVLRVTNGTDAVSRVLRTDWTMEVWPRL